MKSLPILVAVSLALASSSTALASTEVDDAIAAFIDGDGFARQDPQAVDAKVLGSFVHTGAIRPDGAANALEKALLLIDAMETALPRVRYMVRYGQMMQDDTPVSFVTVERYNLGPAIREMVAEDFGEENTSDPEEFGVGPHVAWRLVAMPLMGQTAALLETSRREMRDDEAAGNDCAGRGCLSLDGPLQFVRDWYETPLEVDIAVAYPRSTDWGAPLPAFAAAELSVAAGLAQGDGGEPYWIGPEQPEAARGYEPFLLLTVDFDLGQETNVDAALGQTLLNDDALAEIWVRRNQYSDTVDSPVYWLASTTERSR